MSSLKVLLLGGSGFIGPHFVKAAVDRGHDVSVFTRGIRDADLPPEVETLVGDRDGDLSAITNRDWDAVLDLAAFGPKWIRTLGQEIGERVGHYTFVSTIDVYDQPSRNAGTVEGSPVLEWTDDVDPATLAGPRRDSPDPGRDYGVLKILSEREAEQQYPGRVLSIRPGYIVGPGDVQERFTSWVARLARGGDVLAPGDPRQPVQFVDVRDLAEWTIHAVESGETGPFNTLGPDGSMTMAELLGGIRAIFSVPTRLHWVDIPWVGRQDIVDDAAAEWSFWRFSRDDDIDSSKAVARGFRCRPLAETARWVHDWYASLGDDERTIGPVGGWGSSPPSRIPWQELERIESDIIQRSRTRRDRLA